MSLRLWEEHFNWIVSCSYFYSHSNIFFAMLSYVLSPFTHSACFSTRIFFLHFSYSICWNSNTNTAGLYFIDTSSYWFIVSNNRWNVKMIAAIYPQFWFSCGFQRTPTVYVCTLKIWKVSPSRNYSHIPAIARTIVSHTQHTPIYFRQKLWVTLCANSILILHSLSAWGTE